MQFLSLFAGIGGFDLGLERAGMECVGQVENDPFCIKVLEKHWPDVKRIPDIKDVKGDEFGPVDLICGGFPCQDLSYSGQGAGLNGERSGLWSEITRLTSKIRPRYIIVENVTALLNRGLGRVLGDLAEIGYGAEWHCIPAAYIGAPQLRDRIWIVASPDINGRQAGCLQIREFGKTWTKTFMGERLGVVCPKDGVQALANLARMGNGVPSRVDRLRALGNAVVPQIPEIIGRAILEAEGRQ